MLTSSLTRSRYLNYSATACKTVRPMLSDRCPVCPVCDVVVLWPNGWMNQGATWYGGRPRRRPHCVRWGPTSPQKGHNPKFSAHVYCGQTAGWIKLPLGTEVGLGPGDIVLDGDPPGKGYSSHHFSAHVYCGQTVAHLSNC